jgi:hypothetical protein
MAYQKERYKEAKKHYTMKTKIGQPHENVGELVLITRRDWMLFDWSYLLTKQKINTICVGNHYTQTNTNNVNKAKALLQTIWGKDEQNIVFMRKL